jgi:hypothetical protein
VFKGDKSATEALRWIEEMDTTIDVSGCKDEDKVLFAANSFKGEAHISWKTILVTWAGKKLRIWVGESSEKYFSISIKLLGVKPRKWQRSATALSGPPHDESTTRVNSWPIVNRPRVMSGVIPVTPQPMAEYVGA